jgi:hypothetical protein
LASITKNLIYEKYNKQLMLNYNLLQKTYTVLLFGVFSLSIIALIAELLPEFKAKMIVIPTLILIILLCMLQIRDRYIIRKGLN